MLEIQWKKMQKQDKIYHSERIRRKTVMITVSAELQMSYTISL